jgi:hypothetical protein
LRTLPCAFCAVTLGDMKTTATTSELTPLERAKKIKVSEAAALNDLNERTFRKYYSHLIRRISPNRDAVALGDAIDLPGGPRSKKSA